MDASTVEEYLQQVGGKFVRLEENRWLLAVSSQPANLPILVSLRRDWLDVGTILVNRPEEQNLEELLYTLLRMNASLKMAKFALGESGEIILAVEMPVGDLQFSEFRAGLDALLHYADFLYPEIARMAFPSQGQAAPPTQTDGQTSL